MTVLCTNPRGTPEVNVYDNTNAISLELGHELIQLVGLRESCHENRMGNSDGL